MRLVEGVDYYVENGKWVFTEKFLLTRPCCGNGCRHCPYQKHGQIREIGLATCFKNECMAGSTPPLATKPPSE